VCAGKLRAAGWNEVGLAAVVGQSLVTWGGGSKTLRVLASSPVLARAKDVTLVGEDRAIVALDFSTAYRWGATWKAGCRVNDVDSLDELHSHSWFLWRNF
jgi:hypothetical protein